MYITALALTAFISLFDGLKEAGIEVTAVRDWLSFLPLYAEGIGWIVPAIFGALIGFVISLVLGTSKRVIQA